MQSIMIIFYNLIDHRIDVTCQKNLPLLQTSKAENMSICLLIFQWDSRLVFLTYYSRSGAYSDGRQAPIWRKVWDQTKNRAIDGTTL